MEVLSNLREIEDKGFTVLKGALDKNLLDEIATKTKAYLGQNKSKKWKAGQQAKFSCEFLGESLMDIICNETIVKVCKRMLGAEMRFDHAFGYKMVGTADSENLATKNLHGGVNSNFGMNFYRGGMPLTKNLTRTFRLNVSLALTDFGPKIGGAQALPRTHKGGNKDKCQQNCLPKKINLNQIVIPEGKSGDLLIFADSLVHGSSAHAGERISLYFMYTSGFCCFHPWECAVKPYLSLAKSNLHKKLLSPAFVAKTDENLEKLEWRESI